MPITVDLDADDVAAILEGRHPPGWSPLEQELVDSGWPDDVRRGVELPGWMVARGMLPGSPAAFPGFMEARETLCLPIQKWTGMSMKNGLFSRMPSATVSVSVC